MSRDERKYSRIYHTAPDDPKFRTVWRNDAALALWVRLLMAADASWPASTPMPRSAKAGPLRVLVEAGLVDLVDDDRYRIHGMDAERKGRSDAAAYAAQSRWDAERNADRTATGNAKTMLVETSRTETSRDETSNARERPDGRADLEAFLVITRRAPTPRQRRLLDDVLDRHDLTGPAWAADVMFKNPSDPIGAVIEADKAWRAERIAAAQAAESPKPIPRRPKGRPEPIKDLMAEWAATAPNGDAA